MWNKLAAELFADFSDDGIGGRFTCFDLSAGKFPFAAKVFVGRPLREEHAAIAFDNRADDGHGDRVGICGHIWNIEFNAGREGVGNPTMGNV